MYLSCRVRSTDRGSGEKVVAILVETHARPQTMSQIVGLGQGYVRLSFKPAVFVEPGWGSSTSLNSEPSKHFTLQFLLRQEPSTCSYVKKHPSAKEWSHLLTNKPQVCPSCSNTLTVSRAPYNDAEPDYPNGRNRLECKTCPYQFLLDKRYYERKEMKRKDVEDVIGGKGSWDNVDQTDGEFSWAGAFVVAMKDWEEKGANML